MDEKDVLKAVIEKQLKDRIGSEIGSPSFFREEAGLAEGSIQSGGYRRGGSSDEGSSLEYRL